jgi:hypothetical protein
MHANTWVEFNQQDEFRDRKRRGVVKQVQDNTAIVIDEHTGAQVKSNLY